MFEDRLKIKESEKNDREQNPKGVRRERGKDMTMDLPVLKEECLTSVPHTSLPPHCDQCVRFSCIAIDYTHYHC